MQAHDEAKEREVEDGWVETDNPMAGGTKGAKEQPMDIDEMHVVDAEMIGGEEQEEEAVDIDDMDNIGADNVFASGKYVVKQ